MGSMSANGDVEGVGDAVADSEGVADTEGVADMVADVFAEGSRQPPRLTIGRPKVEATGCRPDVDEGVLSTSPILTAAVLLLAMSVASHERAVPLDATILTTSQ
jgi:hypothetical protein